MFKYYLDFTLLLRGRRERQIKKRKVMTCSPLPGNLHSRIFCTTPTPVQSFLSLPLSLSLISLYPLRVDVNRDVLSLLSFQISATRGSCLETG
jgi:hypothetical protein